MTNSPLIINPNDDSESVAVIFGVPFDSTHSYKPGCRFGPDVIRGTFNNIEIFQPEFGVDLEAVNINDLASKLTKQNIRVDIDDRNDTIGKRIRDAEKEWISYVLVIGEKEVKSTSLSVRDRTTGDVRQLSVEDFVKEIQDAISGKPISKLNSPILLSRRPQIMV